MITKTNIKTTIIVGFVSLLTLASCQHNTIYSDYQSVATTGWHKDSILAYSFDIQDSAAIYQVLLHVRHTEIYPFQNLWFFTCLDGQRDTIEFYLADERGRWLGNGGNGLIDMPILFEDDYRFTNKGEHTLTIQHGMRDTLLRGVSDVGIEIQITNGKE